MSSIASSGPATIATDSTLQVNQTFFLKLPPSADVAMQAREALANRLLFGDLSRLVSGDTAGTTRPAMFLDFIFDSTELSAALGSLAIAGSPSFAATLVPYVFRYMNFDTFPVGNPALPGVVADTATLLAAVSEDALNALRRKKQRFQYDPDRYTSTLPKDIAYPSTVSLSTMDLSGVFTTTVYWANTLTQDFWLESAESVNGVTWNLFPSTSFFLDDSASSSQLPAAPIVRVGNTSSSSTNALNIVVRHQSRLLRNGTTDAVSKLLLYLEFGVASVTEKAAGGCAHCQQLMDWCTNEAGCAALKACVLSAVQNPISQLVSATSTAAETDDLSSLINGCLTGTTTSPVDVNYLMLFTSAIRCQLQRLCALPSPSTSIVIPSGIKLVWGSGKGQHRVQPAAGISNFPAPVSTPLNISLAIGNRVVCYIPVWNNATAASLETKIARSCTFAKYLGAVTANVTSNTAGATAIDIFYDGLVGPLPTLVSVASDATTQAVDATFTTIATPSVRVRYVSAGGPIPFATTTDPKPTEACAECKRLALDVCLRDAKCAAMADCVMQFQNSTSDQAGTKISLEAGINSCLPGTITNGTSSVDVNGASWRKLVNASACYSRTACPLALASVLSSSWSSFASNYLTVGKWSISPAQKLQKLIYTGSTSSLTDLKVPLVLTRDGTAVTSSSAADPDSLTVSLRGLIQYDDIQVVLTTADNTTTASSLTTFSWTISYGHWVGSLPSFISSGNKEWTLVAYPTISAGIVTPNDSILELIPRSSTSTASSTVTSSTTITS
ncbi:Hypothetical protein PHPALM_6466 [Phytophthora palmivora]|uniref:Uncharacterized protein n=1 Tax=Phytophthora palmivora TaxID=4796 RepID=A0A2P4YET2_9STRA|nr:Hypothetical protein PHPALM_6466 [Phytophthora palmivora]